MQIRRRKNRARRRISPLSFRCQTHVTPRTPNFPQEVEERQYVDPGAALNSNPVLSRPVSKKLTSITTTVPAPAPALSPGFPSPGFGSNGGRTPDDHYTTPTSTTSTRSNMPLLNSYNPYMPPNYGNQASSIPGLAVTTSDMSPQMDQRGFSTSSQRQRNFSGLSVSTKPASLWERPGMPSPGRELKQKRGSPTEPTMMTNIQTSFPPPPTPKRKK